MELQKKLPVGVGNTAEVFDYAEGKVVKLYFPYYPKECIDLEFKNSQLMNHFPLPLPKSYELIKEDGRYGIVYDKVAGVPLTEVLLKTLDLEKYLTIFASLHKRILAEKAPSAISIRELLIGNIKKAAELSDRAKETLLSLFSHLPEEDNLCHGDYHLGNVLIDGDHYTLIDFYNIAKGHPYFDIARTVYLTELTPAPEDAADKEEMMRLKKMVTDIYLQKMGIEREALNDYLLVTVAARFAELRPEQELERSTVLRYLKNHNIMPRS